MKISEILDRIDSDSIALPEFQRGFVWNRNQVRQLMESLYRGHPVGSLLVWTTETRTASVRGDQAPSRDVVQLLLDGQQRITALYGLVRGKPPAFFSGNAQAFADLCFHIDEENFAFCQSAEMRDDPLWIDVTIVLQKGVDAYDDIESLPDSHPSRTKSFLKRLHRIYAIRDIDLHIEEVTGKDKTVDVIVDIFNQVNSGGTKLSNGDLALAKMCATWPEARKRMNTHLQRWEAAGHHFKFGLLLRVIAAVLTGEARLAALDRISIPLLRKGTDAAAQHVDTSLNWIGSRLGLDHDQVLGGRYALPVMALYIEQRGGDINDPVERDKLLYWYIHCFLWGRYTSLTETVLSQDLNLIKDTEDGLDRLIGALRQTRGDLRIHPDDFLGSNRGARFYPLLYMLTRVWQARDWETGNELKAHLLGNRSRLELHHIFPKAALRKYQKKQYTGQEINALANFTFLTQGTNQKVSDEHPEDYLQGYFEKDPELLTSHWIPTDPELWRMDRYADFLAARRALLAQAANDFLEALLQGRMPAPRPDDTPASAGEAQEDANDPLAEVNQWVLEKGLPAGEFSYELAGDESNDPGVILDLAWPDGLQEGLSQPVALLLDAPKKTRTAASQAGFRFFEDIEAFQSYVIREILGEEE